MLKMRNYCSAISFAVACAIFSLTQMPPVQAEEYKDVPKALSDELSTIVKNAKIPSKTQRLLEKGAKLPRSEIEPIGKSLAAAGLGPLEYCCFDSGTCECVGVVDCMFMLVSNACDDDQPIVCDEDGCECTEGGPTHCPFPSCCTDNSPP